MNAKPALPHRLGKYRGVQYWRFTVAVVQSGVERDLWMHRMAIQIIAPSPAEALRAIKAEFWGRVSYPTEFVTLGPRGGVESRFIGWDSVIMGQMDRGLPDPCQLLFSSVVDR